MPPPAASRRPAGQLRPRHQAGHSITSCSSRPCGLRHLLPRRQTGHPWSPNRPPQNPGRTLPWRPRDKGGPSPLPEARTPWGGGEDVSAGPFTLLCLHPPSPEPWRGETGPSCQHTGCPHACLAAQACSTQLRWIWFPVIWVLVDRTSENKQPSPEDSPAPPRPAPGGCGELPRQRLGQLLPWSSLGAGRPRSQPSGMQSFLRMCACSCVCVFICMSSFKKQPSLWGSWTLHVRVSPQVPCPPSLSPGPCPSPLPPRQPALLFPAEKRIVGNSRTLPTHPPVPACWGCLHVSPRARGVPHYQSFPPFNKGEERVPTHHQALSSCLVS
uniref:Uncharacterized protein LOC123615271 n=1 Tax=Camelus bactrianus TaxID=9837 RepID=A0A9W3FYD2_CAMBA|nr:uncharacterized protein LOC123615271 [Camelus bactrianus]